MASIPLKRTYSDFRGVDFANDPSLVLLSRSPDALNVWKNYKDTQGSCIESRPGYRELANFEDKINGMYFFNDKVLIHSGTNLYLWDNFPSEPATPLTPLKNDMNDAKSTFAIFKEKLYIVDGANYLVYDGTTLKNVSDDNPYIPTTTISRLPSGGGEPYQDENVLQPKRRNSFVGDGTSTEYYLDKMDITAVTKIIVDDVEVTSGYTVNTSAGKVTFDTAPSAPVLSGDNVIIEFSKITQGYINRIAKCTKMVVFDNRLFFAGNPDSPNAVFHSQLNTPNYVSDLAYYQDGTDESDIKALVVGNNILWVFKEPSQERDTIFYHTATTDSIGKVYPNFQGNVSTGCYSDAINYKDDIVFLSKTGLEGISSNDIASQQLLSHKSSLVDNKLINENNFDLSMMTEWNGYLLILVNSHIYLGDIRQLYQSVNGYEYEWYYWELGTQATTLKEYKGNLYIGAEDGSIFIVEGTNDNGEIIESYWTTPMDNFEYGNKYKTTNKRGGIAKIKTIPNGKVKIAERTNKTQTDKFIKEFASGGFDFGNIDFENFAFTTDFTSSIVYKIKEKKFVELQLKFYSDELDKPFGIYDAIIEAFEGGYVKR